MPTAIAPIDNGDMQLEQPRHGAHRHLPADVGTGTRNAAKVVAAASWRHVVPRDYVVTLATLAYRRG